MAALARGVCAQLPAIRHVVDMEDPAALFAPVARARALPPVRDIPIVTAALGPEASVVGFRRTSGGEAAPNVHGNDPAGPAVDGVSGEPVLGQAP